MGGDARISPLADRSDPPEKRSFAVNMIVRGFGWLAGAVAGSLLRARRSRLLVAAWNFDCPPLSMAARTTVVRTPTFPVLHAPNAPALVPHHSTADHRDWFCGFPILWCRKG